MATFTVPVLSDQSFYTIRVDFTDVEYRLGFQYNQREDSWYLSLLDALSDPIIQSIKLVVGVPLLRGIKDLRIPAGRLIAIDTQDQDLDPGFEDLSSGRVVLCYQDDT